MGKAKFQLLENLQTGDLSITKDGYRSLADAIVKKASEDYQHALARYLQENPNQAKITMDIVKQWNVGESVAKKRVKKELMETMSFFQSDQYWFFTALDPEYLIRLLNAEAKAEAKVLTEKVNKKGEHNV